MQGFFTIPDEYLSLTHIGATVRKTWQPLISACYRPWIKIGEWIFVFADIFLWSQVLRGCAVPIC